MVGVRPKLRCNESHGTGTAWMVLPVVLGSQAAARREDVDITEVISQCFDRHLGPIVNRTKYCYYGGA